jgi:TPR repeat protein
MLSHRWNSSTYLASIAGLAFGAVFLASCSDTGSKPKDTAKTETQATDPAPQTEAQAANLAKLKAELASATSAEIMKSAEQLWMNKDYASAFPLAEMAFKKDGNSAAAYRLGTAYQGGYGVDKDVNKAWEYFSSPSLDESRYALYFRGLLQSDKEFSGFDVAKARASLERAKAMGVKEAEAELAKLPSN